MADYTHLGLNNRLQSTNSLSAKQTKIAPLKFSSDMVVQGKNIRVSKINLGEFVKISGGGSTDGTFNLKNWFDIVAGLTYNVPHSGKPVYGVPHVSIFEGLGTSIDDQIYPFKGINVTADRYAVSGFYDWANWDQKSEIWACSLVDTTGTSDQDWNIQVRWSYLDYNATSGV